MGPVSPQTHSVVISRVPECIIEIDLLSIWQIPHIGSLTYGFRAIMLGKDKWKPLELLPSRKLVNQYCIPRTIAYIRTIIKDLKDAGVLISTAYPFDLPIWPVQKTDGEWQWLIVGLTKSWLQLQVLYQMWFHCLSKLTYPLVTGMQLLIWRILFLPFLSIRYTRNSFFQLASNITSLFYLISISTFQAFVIIYFSGILVIFPFYKILHCWHYADWTPWARYSN